MKILLSILILLATLAGADAAFYQFNRYTTNLDTALVNGVNLTNLQGSNVFLGSINSNKLDAATLALFGASSGNTATNFYTSYASFFGAGVSLTTSPTNIPFTPAVQVVLSVAGTYEIKADIGVKYNGITYATSQNIQLWLQRTNGPAIIDNRVRTLELPVLTTFTGGDVITVFGIIYTATAGDTIQIYADISAAPSAGSVQVDSAQIIARRIY